MNWEDNAFKIKMEPGENYTSCFDFKNQNRIFQYKDLCCYNKKTEKIDDIQVAANIAELKMHINNYNTPKYHIIRTPGGINSEKVINNFKKNITDDYKTIYYDGTSDIEDINNILKKKPYKNTFIFIKEKLRCAKTLTKTHLGILYERYTKKK